MSEGKLSEADLAHFTGSENWYRHGIARDVLFTDGAKYVADQGGAYWLLDEIALAQRYQKAVAAEEFQVWTLTVKDDRTARLACEDGNGKTVFEKAMAASWRSSVALCARRTNPPRRTERIPARRNPPGR
jgi:hypothetical protein